MPVMHCLLFPCVKKISYIDFLVYPRKEEVSLSEINHHFVGRKFYDSYKLLSRTSG